MLFEIYSFMLGCIHSYPVAYTACGPPVDILASSVMEYVLPSYGRLRGQLVLRSEPSSSWFRVGSRVADVGGKPAGHGQGATVSVWGS